MSINITVHGNKLEKTTRESILADPDHVKKERLAERRKQRIEQVRQQSKEVAQQVRKNVHEEILKQERRIEELKHNELLAWREKALAEAREQRTKSLNAVGNAHRAALNEREAEASFEATKRRRTNIALERGKEARRKEKESQLIKKPGGCAIAQSAKKPKHGATDNSSKRQTESATRSGVEEIEQESSSFSTEDEYNVSHAPISIKRNKPVIMDINTDSDESPSVSLIDSHDESNRHFYRTNEKPKNIESSKIPYNALDYRQNENSSSEKSNHAEHSRPRQFSKISELIQKRQPKQLADKSTPGIPEVAETNSTPAKSCLKNYPQQESTGVPKTISQSAKKTSHLVKPSSEISNSVQFYDYDSKFSKQYQPEQGFVRSLYKSQGEINAMESARLEQQLQCKEKARESQKKAEERLKQSLEAEKVRKDCQLLKQQLEALNQDQMRFHDIEGQEPVKFIPIKNTLQQVSERKKKKTEAAFGGDITKPALIVCPKIEKKETITCGKGHYKPIPSNLATADKMSNHQLSCDEVSSSESCVNTLLHFVNQQSDQISRDIKYCCNSSTLKGLKTLLGRINDLKDRIMDEINKCKARDEKNTIVVDKITRHVAELCNERDRILSEEKENIESLKKNLERREKRLKEKEDLLKRKLENINANQITLESAKPVDPETIEQITNKKLDEVPSTVPIEIIIKLRNETTSKVGKSPYKSPRKKSSLIQDFKHAKRKKVALVKQKPSKPSDIAEELEKSNEVSPAGSKSSTSYLSIPEAMHTKLGELLSLPAQQNNSYVRKEKRVTAISQPECVIQNDKKLNPTLLHYIQRLLGMSRSSIDMLGVSSSEIETPSLSLVANPGNISSSESLDVQTERLQRLKEFINDNYSLISDLEESFKSSKSSSSSSSSSKRLAEKVWQAALQKSDNEKVVSNLEKQIKSILKSKIVKASTTKQRAAKANATSLTKRSVQTQVSDISKSDKSIEVQSSVQKNEPRLQTTTQIATAEAERTSQLVDKYAELTTNCTKRITELTDMINKVRKEKQKILETTLTSGSETGRLSTEYCDLPEGFAAKSDDDSIKIIELKSATEGRIESDRVLLEKNKLTGVSRDSGISLSRPLTALDTFESNLYLAEKSVPEKRQDTVPRDITKHSPQRSEDTNPATRKLLRPPATIARYSPQFEDRAHELSTILEVETPATSRQVSNTNSKLALLQANKSGNVEKIRQFPTYEEYVAQHNLEVSQFINVDVSSKLPSDFEKFEDVLNEGDLQYQEFPSLKTYLRHQGELSETQYAKLTSIQSYQQFPSHKSYVAKLGISGLVDSQSIAAVSISDTSNKPEDSESIESLPDVVAELKQRNILTHSFRNEIVANKSQISSGASSATPSLTDLPTKNDATSERTSSNRQAVPSTSKIKSPVKLKAQTVSHTKPNTSPKDKAGKSTDLTGIELLPPSTTSASRDTSESLGRELNEMGLKWASLMLKKSQQSMELGSTSSSFTYEHKSPKKSSGKNKVATATAPAPRLSSNTEDNSGNSKHASDRSSPENCGNKFNLKDFFTKELQKRATTSASVSSTDDSLASQFIKSLLGSANASPTTSSEGRTAPDRQRRHTSTPLQQSKSSPSSKSSQDASKLFSAESCISSVRLSSGPQPSKANSQDRDHTRSNIERQTSSGENANNNDSS